jgi:hypothetical protein
VFGYLVQVLLLCLCYNCLTQTPGHVLLLYIMVMPAAFFFRCLSVINVLLLGLGLGMQAVSSSCKAGRWCALVWSARPRCGKRVALMLRRVCYHHDMGCHRCGRLLSSDNFARFSGLMWCQRCLAR